MTIVSPRMAEIVTPRDITHELRGIGAIQFKDEPFTLSSGLKSHLYFNVGDLVISHPDVKEVIVEAMNQTWERMLERWGIHPDRLVGVPAGMDMLNSSIGDRRRIGQLRVRENVQEHGVQSRIEGNHLPGMKVGINEDVVSTGKSTLHRAVSPLEVADLKPEALVSLIDREYGGQRMMDIMGIKYSPFTKTSQLAQILVADNLVTEQEREFLWRELANIDQTK